MQRGSIALGPRFELWKNKHNQTPQQLATYLGVTIDILAELAAESVPDDGSPVGPGAFRRSREPGVSDDPDLHQLEQLANRYGATYRRLYDVVAMNQMREDQ